jgi:hypothetical protein
MLSAETASGQYPIEAITIMARICQEAEAVGPTMSFFNELRAITPKPLETSETVTRRKLKCIDFSCRCQCFTRRRRKTDYRLDNKWKNCQINRKVPPQSSHYCGHQGHEHLSNLPDLSRSVPNAL